MVLVRILVLKKEKKNVEMADQISFVYVVKMSIYLSYLDRYFH